MSSLDEFEAFLKKVEQIEALVKGISSEDAKTVEDSMKKADKFMQSDYEIEEEGFGTKTGVNKTSINNYTKEEIKSIGKPNDVTSKQPQINPKDMSQEAFMSILEKDANERFERRKENTKLATELKDKGNAEFQKRNYEKAIEFYTEVIFSIVIFNMEVKEIIFLNFHF